jgi:hypothetical protein
MIPVLYIENIITSEQKMSVICILDREQSLGRKEGPPTTHQETKYAHFSLLSSWLRLCINITYIQLYLSNRNRLCHVYL